jgi:hypothetical protein
MEYGEHTLPVLCLALVRCVVDELHLAHVERVAQVVSVVHLLCPLGQFYTMLVVCTENGRHMFHVILVLCLVHVLFAKDSWQEILGACMLYVVGLFDVMSVMHAWHTVKVRISPVALAVCQVMLTVVYKVCVGCTFLVLY